MHNRLYKMTESPEVQDHISQSFTHPDPNEDTILRALFIKSYLWTAVSLIVTALLTLLLSDDLRAIDLQHPTSVFPRDLLIRQHETWRFWIPYAILGILLMNAFRILHGESSKIFLWITHGVIPVCFALILAQASRHLDGLDLWKPLAALSGSFLAMAGVGFTTSRYLPVLPRFVVFTSGGAAGLLLVRSLSPMSDLELVIFSAAIVVFSLSSALGAASLRESYYASYKFWKVNDMQFLALVAAFSVWLNFFRSLFYLGLVIGFLADRRR